MNNNNLYRNILVLIILLLISFFVGRFTSPKEIKTVTITIPAKKGESPIIINPKPIYYSKDSLVYKDTLIYTENPFNKELAEKYTRLENEKDKLLAYLNSIQIRKYSVPFENDTIKITGNFEVQGELKSVKYDWKIKSFTTDVDFKVPKPTMSLLAGGSLENNIDLNNFNLNAKIGLQRINGDIIIGSYGLFNKSIEIGYMFKF